MTYTVHDQLSPVHRLENLMTLLNTEMHNDTFQVDIKTHTVASEPVDWAENSYLLFTYQVSTMADNNFYRVLTTLSRVQF